MGRTPHLERGYSVEVVEESSVISICPLDIRKGVSHQFLSIHLCSFIPGYACVG